jgi:hypothetical protein
MKADQADGYKPYTIEQGSPLHNARTSQAVLTAFGLVLARQGTNSITGTIMGALYEDNVAPTAGATPTDESPLLPQHHELFIDTSFGALGTTKLLGSLSTEWNVSNRFGEVWTNDKTFPSYSNLVEKLPTVELKVKTKANTEGMRFLQSAINGELVYVRVSAVGGLLPGATTARETLHIDMPMEVSAVDPQADDNGIWAANYTLRYVEDNAGNVLTASLLNTLAAL